MEFAVDSVFFEQVAQDLAGFGGVIGEEGGLLCLKPIGALAAGEDRRVESEMAEEVERIGVGLAGLGGDGLEIDAALGQLLDNLGALGVVGPAGAEVFRAGAEGADLFGGVVGEFDDAELFSVGVELVDQFGGDLDVTTIEVEFAALRGRWVGDGGRIGKIADDVAFVLRFFGGDDLGVFDPAVFVNLLLGGEGRFAVEGRVGKVEGGGVRSPRSCKPRRESRGRSGRGRFCWAASRRRPTG